MSLELSHVTVTYDGTRIVKDIELSVASGERFAIMGPSGSGKSTLLRAIAGLAPISSGTVHIDGADVSSVPAHRRRVGLMFQDYALFPHMSVLENVAYGLRMGGVTSAERAEQSRTLLDLVGLGTFADRRPDTLSGGERQRVALARTLAPSPAVVLLDEPLGSLDISLRESLLGETRSILDSLGATSVYVTHDRSEAFAFCDRMAILNEGRVVRLGAPDEIWHNPGSEFVARSIGQTNLVPCRTINAGNRGVCFVPLDAVQVHSEGELKGVVTSTRFEDGSHIVSAVIEPGGGALEMPVPHPMSQGREIRFDVNRDKLILVSGDEI